MLFIADTGSARSGLAVVSEGGGASRYAEYAPVPYAGAADGFFARLNELAALCGVTAAAVTRIAVYTGPGGFTGTRIALSAVAGMRLAADIDVTGIDGFTREAYAAPDAPGYAVFLPGGRGGLYAAALDAGYAFVTEPSVIAARDITAYIGALPAGERLAVIHQDILLPEGVSLPANTCRTAAGVRTMRLMAEDEALLPRLPHNEAVSPVYVRPPDAAPQRRFLS